MRFGVRTGYFEMGCFRYGILRTAHAGIAAGD